MVPATSSLFVNEDLVVVGTHGELSPVLVEGMAGNRGPLQHWNNFGNVGHCFV